MPRPVCARHDSTQTAFSAFIPKHFFNQFNTSFNLAWEVDLWGKFRRGIENAEDTLDASIYNYDDVLVTLLSDVATYYVTMPMYCEERIRYARMNVIEQQKAVEKVEARKKVGVAKRTGRRPGAGRALPDGGDHSESGNRPRHGEQPTMRGPGHSDSQLASPGLGPPLTPKRPIPFAPPEVAVGIPADLLHHADVHMAKAPGRRPVPRSVTPRPISIRSSRSSAALVGRLRSSATSSARWP